MRVDLPCEKGCLQPRAKLLVSLICPISRFPAASLRHVQSGDSIARLLRQGVCSATQEINHHRLTMMELDQRRQIEGGNSC